MPKGKKMRGHSRSCGNKQPFDTYEAADKAAYRPNRRDCMTAYKCKKCKKWHYGHPNPATYKSGAFTQG